MDTFKITFPQFVQFLFFFLSPTSSPHHPLTSRNGLPLLLYFYCTNWKRARMVIHLFYMEQVLAQFLISIFLSQLKEGYIVYQISVNAGDSGVDNDFETSGSCKYLYIYIPSQICEWFSLIYLAFVNIKCCIYIYSIYIYIST